MRTSTVEIVERMIPVALIHAVVWFGVKDRNDPEHAAVLRMLQTALTDEAADLPRHQAESAHRHAKRATETLIEPFVEDQTSCAKFGLAVYYLLNELIDAGAYEPRDGTFMEAMNAVLNPDGTVTELANIEKIDLSAQKQARRLLRAMQSLGYFTTATTDKERA